VSLDNLISVLLFMKLFVFYQRSCCTANCRASFHIASILQAEMFCVNMLLQLLLIRIRLGASLVLAWIADFQMINVNMFLKRVLLPVYFLTTIILADIDLVQVVVFDMFQVSGEIEERHAATLVPAREPLS
jgi:hypothetical protein